MEKITMNQENAIRNLNRISLMMELIGENIIVDLSNDAMGKKMLTAWELLESTVKGCTQEIETAFPEVI